MMTRPVYTLDNQPVELESFLADNMVPGEEAFTPDELDKIRGLRPGEAFVSGGGGWGEFVLRRES